jgi:hypothetical protein
VAGKPEQDADLLRCLDKVAYTLDKAYLGRIANDYFVLPFSQYNEKKNENDETIHNIVYNDNVRALNIDRWVFDKEESISDRFKNILCLFAEGGSNLALVVRRTPAGVKMYFVLKNEGSDKAYKSTQNITLLEQSIKGNFNGTKIPNKDELIKENRLIDGENNSAIFGTVDSIAVLVNVPSEKSDKFISQGIDKLLNGIVPKDDSESYTMIILAEPLAQETIRNVQCGYEELATALTPLAAYSFQSGENEQETHGDIKSFSITNTLSESITKMHSFNLGLSTGISAFASVALPVGALAVAAGASISAGLSTGYGYSRSKTTGSSRSEGVTTGTNYSLTKGESKSTTYNYINYSIKSIIDKIDASIKRIENSKAIGIWKTAVYVLAQKSEVSKNVASFMRSLSQGDQSFIETSAISEWKKIGNNRTDFDEIKDYITHFTHPFFANRIDNAPNQDNQEQTLKPHTIVNFATNINTVELSNIITFPRHSITGLPVVEFARFGRMVVQPPENSLDIGQIYHMTEVEKTKVAINKNDLTGHMFITGITGSGKSNAIYQIVDKLCPKKDNSSKNGIKFLVIESAKGEYKDVFGGRKDVDVYITNPAQGFMLRLNPFSFEHKGIHVLEHIDRLVEIFNACWPMFAAMPAILKESIGLAYEDVGWNLKTSKYPGVFPTFDNVLKTLKRVIESSEFSRDTDSDYKGALITRVRNLTKNIYGSIFGESEDVTDSLFSRNSIVDLSLLSSAETKALIMGILVMKLQEYRTANKEGLSNDLKHITVLEEAHNLLRRTSSEQKQESANLQGKAVEMIANSIAEMRSFGEGFIIADQSPGLLDISVIRNTNTKVCLRLPDENDRVLVGRAMSLNDAQIADLPKLDRGVAVVHQSGWLEAVLCYFDEFEKGQMNGIKLKEFRYQRALEKQSEDSQSTAIQKLFRAVFIEPVEFSDREKLVLYEWREKSPDMDSNGRDLTYKLLSHAFAGRPLKGKLHNAYGVHLIKCLAPRFFDFDEPESEAYDYLKRVLNFRYEIDVDNLGISEIELLDMKWWNAEDHHENHLEQMDKPV